MKRTNTRRLILTLAWTCILLGFATSAQAKNLILTGEGNLADSTPPVGATGEAITVTVYLNTDDFNYVSVANEDFHYFVPNKTVPVSIVGETTGAYPNVSPVSRFIALNSDPDQISIDVEAGLATTSLVSSSCGSSNCFDGDVTPFTPTELFDIFVEAIQDPVAWDVSSLSSVFAGPSDELLFLGELQWSVVEPGAPHQVSILPTFDVQLRPGNEFPLGEGMETLVIDGGFGATVPPQDVLIEYPLGQIPLAASITSAQLLLDAETMLGSPVVDVLGYEGDGLASLSDEFASTTLLGASDPITEAGDVVIDLDPAFIQSLLGDASHLGLRLAISTLGPFVNIAASESTTGVAPTLVLDYLSEPILGDMNGDGALDENDINPFVQALTDRAGFESSYPDVDADLVGDINQDTQFNLGDVQGFKALLAPPAAAASPAPEPSAALLALLAACSLAATPRRRALS